MSYKSVGIRELKTNLSKYLKKVKAGGELLISERGKTIAQIIPVAPEKRRNELSSLLLKLSGEGKIILPIIYRPPKCPLRRKRVKGSPFSEAVIEGRR